MSTLGKVHKCPPLKNRRVKCQKTFFLVRMGRGTVDDEQEDPNIEPGLETDSEVSVGVADPDPVFSI